MSQLVFKNIGSEANFEIGDASGYRFNVRCTFDEETGWTARVQVTNFGMKTSEAAIDGLVPPLEHLLRMLNERSFSQGGPKNESSRFQIGIS